MLRPLRERRSGRVTPGVPGDGVAVVSKYHGLTAFSKFLVRIAKCPPVGGVSLRLARERRGTGTHAHAAGGFESLRRRDGPVFLRNTSHVPLCAPGQALLSDL